jgi:hypothetical protein
MVMKKTLHITAIIDQPGFLEDIVEKLAYRHYEREFRKSKMPFNRELLETSSTETYVSGTMAIKDSDQQINMPFITRFLFSCVKVDKDVYSLEWGISLS